MLKRSADLVIHPEKKKIVYIIKLLHWNPHKILPSNNYFLSTKVICSLSQNLEHLNLHNSPYTEKYKKLFHLGQ